MAMILRGPTLQSGVTEKLLECDMPCKLLCISSDECKACDNGQEWRKLVGQIVCSVFFFKYTVYVALNACNLELYIWT